MTDTSVKSQEERQADLSPETHNDEQDDHRSQAQEVTEQALDPQASASSPTDSTKPEGGTVLGDDAQDTIDHMRDMESSGRIDMDAYAGEPNHDDNSGKYGAERDPEDPLEDS